ncbi:unnamed protein product [Larinioides sclopetarius]|uniref:TM7S3/TM198-like domain-containing protein n=1 Tax=Larinioides sclopetarius TaxID=280406 RepID=A0AAV2AAS8_9ARAC
MMFSVSRSPFPIMSKSLSGLFVSIYLLCFSSGLSGSEDSITLSLKTDGNRTRYTLHRNSSLVINIINVPTSISAVTCQVHTQTGNLTLSEQPRVFFHNSITGKNIGLVIKLHNSESEKQVWLSNLNQEDVPVLIVITALDSFGPIPGGCNMEFPTEIAPYLRLKSDSLKVYLEFQHASFGSRRDEPPTKCSFSLPYVTYDIYVLFLEENDFGESEFFKKVEYMSNVSSIKEHSSKAKSYSLHPDTRFSFLLYPNLGVVYNVIAKFTLNNEIKESAYVPVVSYGCSSFDFTETGCRIKYSFKGKLFLFLISIFGFIVAFFGHSFISGGTAELSMVIGILGGIFFLFLWLWLRHPIILFLLNGFVFGFLISATIVYTPLGNMEIFINSKNFWCLLSLGTLCITVFAITIPFLMTAVGSSIVGCYVMLLFYDDFVGTRLSYIILNIIKRAVSKTRIFAANDVPFQTNDIIMSTVWIVFSLIAMIVWLRKRQTTIYGITRANSGYFTYSLVRNRGNLAYLPPEHDSTHQPLLRENNAVFYQTFPQ